MPRYDSPYDPSTMPGKLEHVLYEKKGHVAYVTINRPEVRNALHSYAYAELRSCWRDIGLDPDIYVAIVTGAGEAFCAGRDVKFLASYQAQGKRTPHEDPNNPLYSPCRPRCVSTGWRRLSRRRSCPTRATSTRSSPRARTAPRAHAPSARSASPCGRCAEPGGAGGRANRRRPTAPAWGSAGRLPLPARAARRAAARS